MKSLSGLTQPTSQLPSPSPTKQYGSSVEPPPKALLTDTSHPLFFSVGQPRLSLGTPSAVCVWGGLLSFSECGVGAPPLSVSFLQLTRNVLPASHTSPHRRHSATSTSAHLQQETGTLRKKRRTCLFPFSLSLSSVLPLSTRRVFHVRRYRGLPHVGFSVLHIMG